MNIPGRAEGNWAWRATETIFVDPVFCALSDLTLESNRRCALEGPSCEHSASDSSNRQALQNCA
jgi:hypothetical protein